MSDLTSCDSKHLIEHLNDGPLHQPNKNPYLLFCSQVPQGNLGRDGVKVDNTMETVSMASGGTWADGGSIASSSRKVRACSFFRDPEGERIFLGLHHESEN
jgi:hypothetical protein